MRVQKRDGTYEKVSFDKVLRRLEKLSDDLNINIVEIAQKVCSRIYDGVKTDELDELAGQLCSSLIADNPDYDRLGSRIVISNHHKKTSPSLSETIDLMYNNKNNKLVSDELYNVVMQYKDKLNSYIDYSRDYFFDYFGFKTLEKSYLIRSNDHIYERPQHMIMRVSIGIHGFDIKDVLETYDYISNKLFIHATPTLFNFGTPRSQGSSCFLLHMNEDSVEGIFDTDKECALISKYAGGIGLHIHNIRAKNSLIRGTNGKSTGIVPMLRLFNSTARFINQGGKRNGSFAIYLEPWHADIESFLEMKKNHGNEEERARDLFYSLWIPDLFMERVKADEDWCLMCPDKSPGLADVYGDEFKELYIKYENEGNYIKKIKAQKLWYSILDSQIETGTPYMLYKDAVNKKTNQSNLGTIKSSNLCTEICQYTSPEEIAVCNLASICLPTYVNNSDSQNIYFDFEKLRQAVKIVTKNLNKIIDKNFYPVKKAEVSNMKHRPIGIGVQGLADTYFKMKYPFESEKAFELNKNIFETIYFSSLEASMEISKKRHEAIINNDSTYEVHLNDYERTLTKYKGAYSSFEGSPVSKGILQFDMWNTKPTSGLWDWDGLRTQISEWGIRNSLLLAPMPTASTAQIMGFNESIEAITSNIYKRKTLAGEFILVNKYLVNELINLKLWSNDLKEQILINEGSIQNINQIPQDLKDIYKTVWEIKQKNVIDQAADRGVFICQSQSMNLFVDNPIYSRLTTMHFYSWNKGLKTGMYYLRTKPKANTQQFTIDPTKNKNNQKNIEEEQVCESCSA